MKKEVAKNSKAVKGKFLSLWDEIEERMRNRQEIDAMHAYKLKATRLSPIDNMARLLAQKYNLRFADARTELFLALFCYKKQRPINLSGEWLKLKNESPQRVKFVPGQNLEAA